MHESTPSHHQPTPSNRQPEPPAFGSALAAAVVLLVVAVCLLVGPWQFTNPVRPAVVVAPRMIDPTPVRQPRYQPLTEIAGKTYHCSDCHKNFGSPPVSTLKLTQHMGIVLRHGLNDRCFNCHNVNNRDTYVGDWGEEIPMDQPQRLCGKCHGPVYRDWLNGAHGRSSGYWDKSRGTQTRLKCIACHDPHAPSFSPLHPAPAPNTLRMGDQSFELEAEAVANPLHVYRQNQPELAVKSKTEDQKR